MSPSIGWVLRFTPLLAEAARPCRHAVGDRWQVDETYLKVAGQEPLPGKDWICWSDGLFGSTGSRLDAHGGSKHQLKLLQASRLSMPIEGKGELEVIGGPVTRQAVRLRILFQIGPPIDLVPLDVGPQFPVKFYAVCHLQSGNDDLQARTRGCLRQGGPPNCRAVGNNNGAGGQRL